MPVSRPRKNRLTPYGSLQRSAARGLLMGNRGNLHDRDGEITKSWKPGYRAWVCCVTVTASGWRVPFDRPDRYTPLFALDEAVFLAAGHRPCGQCRHEAYSAFKAAWAQRHGSLSGRGLGAKAIDDVLQAARVDRAGTRISFQARCGDLPDGTFVSSASHGPNGAEVAKLLWRGLAHLWSHEGYGAAEAIDTDAAVEVLTPAPIVDVLRAGYVPMVAL